ncbi:unnamed protein product [Prorocentrum cordatum]|uniref:Mitochondrial import inner membrane translocase subunit TIM22 n=1 Tax=Prorocentrum cordatum TaxID=2364126 RepID=A0ABN9WWS9_9DINO|nr:unnamed protein product [Polarella glacialis]
MAAASAPAARGAPAAIRDDPQGDPSVEELLQDAESAFGEIFSVRAPRDVFAGLWSGASCVLSGIFIGLAGLITQPFEGFRDAGVPGCFRGVALGVASGLFFGLTGLCTGVFQAPIEIQDSCPG